MAGLASKTSVVVAARFATRGAQLISFVVLARVLSAERFGDYGVLISAVFLAGLIGNLGLRQAAAHSIGRNELSDGEVASTILLVWPILSAGCCAALWMFNRHQMDLLTPGQSVAIFVAVFALLFLTLLQGVFLGRGETSSFALADSGPRIAQSALVVVLWLAGLLTLQTALLSFAAGFLLLTPFVARRAYRTATNWRPAFRALPRMVRFGFLFALSLFLITLQGRVGLFFLRGAEGAQQAGQFFAAQRASEIFLDVATAAALVLFSETARSKDPAAAIASAARVATGLFVTFSLLGLVIAALSPLLVSVALGPSYAQAEGALFILSLGLGPVAAARIMNSVMSGLGRPWMSGLIALVGLTANIAVCALAVPRWGASGAAVALVVGQTTCCILYIVAGKLIFGLGLADALPRFGMIGTRLRERLARRRTSRPPLE